jgi:hypothetical protein
MEERPAIWRVAANILNKQSRTADKGWSSSLGIGQDVDNSSPEKLTVLKNIHAESFGPGLILWYVLQGGEVYRGFGWGNLRERDHLEDPGRDGMIILYSVDRAS